MTEFLTKPQSLGISEHSTMNSRQAIKVWLTLLQQASLVNHSRSQASNSEQPTSGICGPRPSSAYAWYDRDTACWRTYQGCLLQDTLEEYSETLPRQGMMRDGRLYRQRIVVHRTGESGCGLWRTPTADDANNATRQSGAFQSLTREVRKNAAVGGLLNPDWVEWLMGWPIGATALEPLAMARYRQWCNSHGKS